MHQHDDRPPWITLPVGLLLMWVGWHFWLHPVAFVAGLTGIGITLKGIGDVITEARIFRRPPYWPVALLILGYAVMEIGTPHLKWTYVCRDRNCEYLMSCTYIGYQGEVTVWPKLYESCPLVILR